MSPPEPTGQPADAAPPQGVSFDEIHEMSAQRLLRRTRRLLWLSLLPLLALVLVLAVWQALSQWQRVIDDAGSELRTQRFAFEVIARDASHHVADLRHWMQQELLRDDGRPDPAVAAALQPRRASDARPDGYTLDALPELLRGDMAQLLWPQQGKGSAPPPAALRRAQALSSVIAIAHQRHSDFAWSYFFGLPERHLVLMPWVPSSSVAEQVGAGSLSAAVADWYGYEVVTAGLPDKNPLRQPYWTAPYLDAGGQGLLVSHAAPVVAADEVRGIVGTDVKLSTLETLLDRLPGGPWQAWVLDDAGHVLADRQQPVAAPGLPGSSAASAASSPTPMHAQRLPGAIDRAALARAVAARGEAVSAGGQRLIALAIAGAPWTVVLAAPDSALLLAALPQVLPYSLIVLALLAAWLAGHAMLRQRIVTPMLGVLGYLQRLSSDPAAPEPRLGPRWQPWLQMVSDTFSAMRSAARRERSAETLKSAIVDHAQNAVVVADVEDRIVEFNAAAEALLGCSREQALGRRVCELICPERLQADYQQTTRLMRAGDPDHLMGRRQQRTVRRADGSELPVEAVMWMTQTEDASYFTLSMSDLTPMQAAQDVIERQREALRQSEKLTAMGSLLAGVAHELNNPLTIVMGRANLLEDKTEGTPLHDDAVLIRQAAERCGRIVRTFLNMARNRPAQRKAVQLNELVRAAAEMLGYTLRSHGITLDLQLDSGLPEAQLDADQIGQVVLNLIVNAQQALAAHEGVRQIQVRSGHTESASVPTIWLSVQDSGPGVAQSARERIFDPFFTTKGEGKGTGLGLSVSRAIVREHGGELLLQPHRPAGGACFMLTLPLQAPATAKEN